MLPLTLLLMQRSSSKAVTGDILILTPCDPKDQDGLATFGIELAVPQPVRVVEGTEITELGLRNALKQMRDYEREEFRAVGALLSAFQSKDELALARARDHVARAHALKREGDRKLGIIPAKEEDLEFGRLLIGVFGLAPGQEKEAIERYNDYRHGPRAEASDEYLLSELMSRALDSVRLVLWHSGEQLRPAIYCPEIKHAVYVFLLMRIGRGHGWGVCPHCGGFFFKRKRSDQNYCTIAHREAHRVARWRAAKKSRKGKRRGGPNGTRKTR